jgi:hypothetical protein
MQRADPLSASNSGRASPAKSPEDATQSPERRGEETIVRQGDDDVEKEAAARLAYDTIEDTKGKS